MPNQASSSTGNKEGSSKSSQVSKPEGNTAIAVAMASAKSFGDVFLKGFKGLVVHVPLAAAEGFRNVPALY